MPGVNRQGQAHIVSTAIPLPRSGKAIREVEATPWFRTSFSVDPQPASISPTVNVSIVFICGSPLIVAASFTIRQSKTSYGFETTYTQNAYTRQAGTNVQQF